MPHVRVAKTPQLTREVILDYAREVFSDPPKVYSWLTTPNQAFNGMRPRDLIDMGAAEDLLDLYEELGRIDNGLF